MRLNVAVLTLVGFAFLALQTVDDKPARASSCTMWDVKDICCPSACAAKKSSRWADADRVLQSCMKGLGCSDSDVNGATVFMKCDCPK